MPRIIPDPYCESGHNGLPACYLGDEGGFAPNIQSNEEGEFQVRGQVIDFWPFVWLCACCDNKNKYKKKIPGSMTQMATWLVTIFPLANLERFHWKCGQSY